MDSGELRIRAGVLFGSGLASYEAGNLRAAGEAWTAAAKKYRDFGDFASAVICEMDSGVAYRGLRDYGEVIARFAAARTDSVSAGLAAKVASCDRVLGSAYHYLGNYRESINRCEAARSYFLSVGLLDQVATCERDLGDAFHSKGDYREAIAEYEAARAHFVVARLPEGVASCDRRLGGSYHNVGDYQEAISRCEAARSYFLSVGLLDQVATCDQNLGDTFHSKGDYREAIAKYEAARAHFVVARLPERVASCDRHLGASHHNLGKYQEAIAHLEAARSRFVVAEMPEQVASCDRSLGGIYNSLGEYGEAIARAQMARSYFVEAGLSKDVAGCDYILAIGWSSTVMSMPAGPERVILEGHAVSASVRAAIYLDSVRFTLAGSGRRKMWFTNKSATTTRLAFRLANEMGDRQLVADLVMAGRSAGTYAVSHVVSGDDGDAMGALEMMLRDSEAPQISSADARSVATVASAAACRVLGAEGLRLEPSPHIRAADGHIVLAEHYRTTVAEYGTEAQVPPRVLRSSILVPIA